MIEDEICHPTQIRGREVPDYIDPVTGWQLVTGKVQLFIAGVPANAWFPVSRPNSSGPATPEEYALAEAAVAILRVRHHNTTDVGPELIKAILIEVGWEPDEFTRYPKEL